MNLATLQPIAWETRNLGMPSYALRSSPDSSTRLDALRADISALGAAHPRFFVQARTEPGHPLTRVLHEAGFHCAETALSPHCNLERNEPLARYDTDPGTFLPSRYDAADFALEAADRTNSTMLDELAAIAGRAFAGDRFHLDAHCDAQVADARYSHWLRDLWAEDAVHISIFRYRADAAGFLARRGNALLLAGFEPGCAQRGWGDYFWLGVMQQLRDEGFTDSHTSISAANVAVLNLYARLGWKFRNPVLTFHFWGGR